MIIVRENEKGEITPLSGNPVLTSLNGEHKAPLRVILHESWTAQDRAAFGVHLVEPVTVPEGKEIVGKVSFVRTGDTITASATLRDAPVQPPKPITEGAEETLSAWAQSLGLTLDDVRAVLGRRKAALAKGHLQ